VGAIRCLQIERLGLGGGVAHRVKHGAEVHVCFIDFMIAKADGVAGMEWLC
jgi:hypothetical protein